MARQSKKGELYKEAWKRTPKDTREERDLGYGRLLDYKGSKKVEMFWNVNPEMAADSLFILKVDGVELILDSEEFLKFLRWA